MGTERDIEYKGPCHCGNGIFQIDDCSVDHAWPTATPQWYETRIDCPVCAKRFSLEKRGRHFVLIERSVLREREQRKAVANTRAKQIMADPEVKTAVNSLESLLDSQPSVAAVFRLLKSFGLENCTVGTFRKHWTNGKNWSRFGARPGTLEQIFKLVGMPTVRLESMLAELAALEKHAAQPPDIFGDPVYTLS